MYTVCILTIEIYQNNFTIIYIIHNVQVIDIHNV
jgi:hypothetical protein